MTGGQSWPADADDVVRWARAMLQSSDPEVSVTGLDRVRVRAELDGSDLTSFLWDATDVSLELQAGDGAGHPASSLPRPEPTVVRRRPGKARSVRFTAQPLRLQEVAISFDAQLTHLPIAWLVHEAPTDPDVPESVHGLEADGDGSGRLELWMRADDVGTLAAALMRPALAASGVSLSRLILRVAQDGEDGIRISGRAGVRWKLLRASARGEARLGVSPDGVVAVRDLRISSVNPLIAVGLRIARKAIRTAIGRSHDLNGELPGDGSRLHDVRVTVREELRISAQWG
ncbi:hypothetical protein [Microbacterium tumbae]